jgi:hypothetical protein
MIAMSGQDMGRNFIYSNPGNSWMILSLPVAMNSLGMWKGIGMLCLEANSDNLWLWYLLT